MYSCADYRQVFHVHLFVVLLFYIEIICDVQYCLHGKEGHLLKPENCAVQWQKKWSEQLYYDNEEAATG